MKQHFIIALLVLASGTTVQAGNAPQRPPSLQGIGIEQRLNATVPLDTPFRDEQGSEVRLGKYFQGRPVLLVPVYYTLPHAMQPGTQRSCCRPAAAVSEARPRF